MMTTCNISATGVFVVPPCACADKKRHGGGKALCAIRYRKIGDDKCGRNRRFRSSLSLKRFFQLAHIKA